MSKSAEVKQSKLVLKVSSIPHHLHSQAFILNLNIQQRLYPDTLKNAKVTPIFEQFEHLTMMVLYNSPEDPVIFHTEHTCTYKVSGSYTNQFPRYRHTFKKKKQANSANFCPRPFDFFFRGALFVLEQANSADLCLPPLIFFFEVHDP